MAKSEEEKKKETGEKRLKEEAEAAELLAESERVAKEKTEKDAARDASRQETEGTSKQEKVYTESQVIALIKRELAKANPGNTDLEDEEAWKQKKVRIPRFMGKFIYKFKNTNTDEYFPELVVHAFDVWSDTQKRNEAFVTVVFEDNTELNVPLYTVLTKSQKVWVDLVEIVADDTSYSAGVTERAEVKDWSRKGTGQMVKMKVKQADYSYKVKFPNGKEQIVGKEVINW